MSSSLYFPKIVRKRSKLHGWGVFAAEPINKNKIIIDYAGELISNKDSDVREDKYLNQGCIWVFRVNCRWSRDAASAATSPASSTIRARRTATVRSSRRPGRSGSAPASTSSRATN